LTTNRGTPPCSRGGGARRRVNGERILYVPDPDPKKVVDRLGVIGGHNGDQVLHEIRVRVR